MHQHAIFALIFALELSMPCTGKMLIHIFFWKTQVTSGNGQTKNCNTACLLSAAICIKHGIGCCNFPNQTVLSFQQPFRPKLHYTLRDIFWKKLLHVPLCNFLPLLFATLRDEYVFQPTILRNIVCGKHCWTHSQQHAAFRKAYQPCSQWFFFILTKASCRHPCRFGAHLCFEHAYVYRTIIVVCKFVWWILAAMLLSNKYLSLI